MQAGDGKTALDAHHFFFGGFDDLGVDDDVELLWLGWDVFILFFLVFAFGIFYDCQLLLDVDLRSSQPNAGRFTHGFDHIVN